VEFGDVPADILIFRVAEQRQFGLVRPKDRAIGSHPVEGDGCILHKIREILLTGTQESVLRFEFGNTL